MATRSLTLSAFTARRLPDEDIFVRTLRGDPMAFAEVYRRYHKRIYGYCLARSLDPDAASDAAQEVFMRLLRAEPDSIDKPRAWLFSVARNVCIDAIRKHARVEPVESMPDETAALGVAAADDPAEMVLLKAEGRDAFLALRRINPRYRTALILREIHGQSSLDIGEALDATPGAVDTLVSRARDAFGVAYAGVLGLTPACRASIELIYRRLGTGISPLEEMNLESHFAECDRCRREAKKASTPNRLAALLPFLLPARSFGRGLLTRAAAIQHAVPDATVQQAAAIVGHPAVTSAGAKIAAAAVAVVLVAIPVVGGVASREARDTRPTQASASGTTGTSSHGSDPAHDSGTDHFSGSTSQHFADQHETLSMADHAAHATLGAHAISGSQDAHGGEETHGTQEPTGSSHTTTEPETHSPAPHDAEPAPSGDTPTGHTDTDTEHQ